MAPEMFILKLIAEKLDDKEAILVHGCETFNTISLS